MTTPTKTPAPNGAKWLTAALRRAHSGSRNDTGFWLACQLRDDGIPLQDAERIARAYAARMSEGYTETEALASVQSAYSKPPRPAAAKGSHKTAEPSFLRANSNPPTAKPKPAANPDNWQRQTAAHLARARARLTTGEGEPARKYLESRGICLQAAQMCGIGATLQYNRPALAFAHHDLTGTLTAVDYRFYDDYQPRYSLRKGSHKTGLFICPFAQYGAVTLAVCEGELNAVSVFQEAAAYGLSVDAVSIGAQGITQLQTAALVQLAKRYRRVVLWLDEAKTAAALAAALPNAIPYQSAHEGTIKLDANAILTTGEDLLALLLKNL